MSSIELRYHVHSVKAGGGWRAAMSAAGFLCLPAFFLVTLASSLCLASNTKTKNVAASCITTNVLVGTKANSKWHHTHSASKSCPQDAISGGESPSVSLRPMQL